MEILEIFSRNSNGERWQAATPAQVALAPGAETFHRADSQYAQAVTLGETIGSASLNLTDDGLSKIATTLAAIEVSGARGTEQEKYR